MARKQILSKILGIGIISLVIINSLPLAALAEESEIYKVQCLIDELPEIEKIENLEETKIKINKITEITEDWSLSDIKILELKKYYVLQDYINQSMPAPKAKGLLMAKPTSGKLTNQWDMGYGGSVCSEVTPDDGSAVLVGNCTDRMNEGVDGLNTPCSLTAVTNQEVRKVCYYTYLNDTTDNHYLCSCVCSKLNGYSEAPFNYAGAKAYYNTCISYWSSNISEEFEVYIASFSSGNQPRVVWRWVDAPKGYLTLKLSSKIKDLDYIKECKNNYTLANATYGVYNCD